MVIEVKIGCKVRFMDGDNIVEGMVNGEPQVAWSKPTPVGEIEAIGSYVLTYIPVYVHERDTTIYVNGENVVEVKMAPDPVAA